MKNPKLSIELIPSTSFYTNARSILPKKEWDRLRKQSYANANFKCQICGNVGTNQGYNHKLECHEIWKYKKNGEQVLKSLISLCPRCHMTKHIGRTIAIGKKNEIFKHIAKVNHWPMKTVKLYVGYCFQEHKEKSKIKWKLNLNVLVEKYNVNENLIKLNPNDKIPKLKPWKYKKKKKKKIPKRPKKYL